MGNCKSSIEYKIKPEELFIKDEVDKPEYELTTTEENNDLSDNNDTIKELMSEANKLTIKKEDDSEGSVEFQIKSEELFITDEGDEPAYELPTTEENNDLSDDGDTTNKLMLEENKLTIKKEDDLEGSVEFQIKSEELFIKNEVDEPAYELATAEENNDWINCEKQDANESSNLVILDQAKQKSGTSEKKLYKCEECQKQLTGKGNLRRHMLIHEGRKPYKCQECRKQFTQSGNLKMHMMMHEGKRPYECQKCRKRFIQKSDLTRHMLIHEGKKPHQCLECPERFTLKCNLRRHMLIHEGGREPYKCQECQKEFTYKGDLTRHMLIHEGKSPYNCKECRKEFNKKSNLTRHMLIHEGKKPHKCLER